MTVPALVHQMSFTGSLSGIKGKMTSLEETHGWHLTTKEHKNGGLFFFSFLRPRVQTVKREEEERTAVIQEERCGGTRRRHSQGEKGRCPHGSAGSGGPRAAAGLSASLGHSERTVLGHTNDALTLVTADELRQVTENRISPRLRTCAGPHAKPSRGAGWTPDRV